MKRFVNLALALLLLCCLAVPAGAVAAQKGSIEVSVWYEDVNITGGDLIAVRVGYVDDEHNTFRKFVADSEITGIGESKTVTELQNFYSAYKQTFQFDVFKTEVKNGIGLFSDLPQGLYLVYQETAASGYNKLPAFLVTVPYKGELDVSITSKTELGISAKPEIEPTEPPSSDKEKLPQTGQLTWPIPWLTVAGLTLFVLGWWLRFCRKEETQ